LGIPVTGLPPILGGTSSGSTSSFGTSGGITGGGGGDPIASMVMSFAFPIMKPIIEEQVRRVTITVMWKEGDREQSFDVVQFLVNELPYLQPVSDEDDVTPAGTPGAPGTPTPATGGNTPGTQAK
jgi:hypothetical protein